MKYDVIIPVYNTNKNDLVSCLSSILMQSVIEDVTTIIIDDCSKEKNDDVITKFSNLMNIKYIELNENGGVGNARNVGLDNCDGDIIMFCDSDDCFLSPFAFEIMCKPFKEENVNITMCSFLEQLDCVNTFNKKQYNLTWLHGKAFRTSFIKSNNIKFPTFRYNEDVGFNLLCWSCTELDNIIYNDDSVHIWRSNPNSITRSQDSGYKNDGLFNFVEAYNWYLAQCKERNILNIKFVKDQVLTNLMMLYWYAVECRNLYDENYVAKFDSLCGDYCKMVIDNLTEYVNDENFDITYMNSLQKCKNVVNRNVPSITIYDWLFKLAKEKDIRLS